MLTHLTSTQTLIITLTLNYHTFGPVLSKYSQEYSKGQYCYNNKVLLATNHFLFVPGTYILDRLGIQSLFGIYKSLVIVFNNDIMYRFELVN